MRCALGQADPFHEEVGYWLWDPGAGQVIRGFMVPRGVAVLAGGRAAPGARTFTLRARLGDPCFGIASNPFLHGQFRTVAYTLTVEIFGRDSFRYAEDTVLRMPGRPAPFHHTDTNTLRRCTTP